VASSWLSDVVSSFFGRPGPVQPCLQAPLTVPELPRRLLTRPRTAASCWARAPLATPRASPPIPYWSPPSDAAPDKPTMLAPAAGCHDGSAPYARSHGHRRPLSITRERGNRPVFETYGSKGLFLPASHRHFFADHSLFESIKAAAPRSSLLPRSAGLDLTPRINGSNALYVVGIDWRSTPANKCRSALASTSD